MQLLLGCIADDITGGSDLALMLAKHGMPTTLCLGTPGGVSGATTPAMVIALKIRTVAAAQAIEEARAAGQWLQQQGAARLFYKYCSTFDSTAEGNIGPVTDTLLELVNEDFTVLLPAFPENGRIVRNGSLFVDGVPLADSPMGDHPLTPMTDSFLPRLMDAQTAHGFTSHVSQDVVDLGADELQAALEDCRSSGSRYAVIDTASAADFATIAAATSGLGLMTGGSGIACALPDIFAGCGDLVTAESSDGLPKTEGYAAVLAGSCSPATLEQVRAYKKHAESIVVDPEELHDGVVSQEELASRASDAVRNGDVLVHSASEPQQLRHAQDRLGVEASAELVESTIGQIAKQLAEGGVRKFIVAGGETSGEVARSLSLSQFRIGPQIDPGVPWMYRPDAPNMCVAFKSGNFGAPDFFEKALGMLP